VLNHLLTFAIFLLIGIEIRSGADNAKAAVLPSLAALGGMVLPAAIYLALGVHREAWAVVMPTDVALAIGALSLLGSTINPSVRIFLMTLAVADDFFSLVVIGIFYRSDLNLSSAFYTLGAAAIGVLLPGRQHILKVLAPLVTFGIIPIYILINLLLKIDLSTFTSATSLSVIAARIIGKVLGILLTTWLLTRVTSLSLPSNLNFKEVVGIGLLSGMGMTVSLVIAGIVIKSQSVFAEIRWGLFLAALISGLLGLLWLKRFPASL
jgi:NhaA family Na+:H+ antiporter